MKDFYGKKFWKIKKEKNLKFSRIFFLFCFNFFFEFFSIFFLLPADFFLQIFFPHCRGERSERRGGVGERSEPPAGGLAVGAEGSVNSEF